MGNIKNPYRINLVFLTHDFQCFEGLHQVGFVATRDAKRQAPMTWKIGREEANTTAVMHRRVSE